MTKDIETGGNAFPSTEEVAGDKLGITKRDYFAAMIIQGLLANDWLQKKMVADSVATEKRLRIEGIQDEGIKAKHNQEWHAKTAYQFADAMLKARDEIDE